jgi:hypothetical protein
MTTRIFVNRNAIEKNEVAGSNRPVYTVAYPDGTFESGHEVVINGPSRAVYGRRNPVNGARCWVETEAPVTIRTEDS